MKKFLIFLLILVVLAVGAVAALPLIMSSDSLRAEFSKKVSTVSGLDIELGGSVNFSLFPDLGLVANEVKLAQPDGSLDVSLEKLVAKVNFLSLLSGKTEISGLILTRPIANIKAIANTKTAPARTPDDATTSDPFAIAVEQLEKLSLKSLVVTDGNFTSTALDGTITNITNIDLQLSAPSLDGEISLIANASTDGRNISLSTNLAALRPLLERQPSKVELALKLSPAPHPLLKDMKAQGFILLASDGSYHITDGQFTSSGQPLRLDAEYKPGERPYASLSLKAKRVNLGKIESTTVPQTSAKAPGKNRDSKPASDPDLSFLNKLDADISVKIDSFVVDNIEANDIDLNLNLANGILNTDLGNARIAKGKIALALNTDFNTPKPTTRGTLIASSLAVENLAKLAKIDSPLSGNLAMKTSYAFLGASAKTIQESFNLAGGIDFTNGALLVPQLAAISKSATRVSNLNFSADIKNAQKPVEIKGNLVWNGETVNYAANVTPHEILKSNAGPVKFKISTAKFKTDFSGEVDLSGSAFGKLNFSTPALGKLLAWLGQGDNADLKALSFDGDFGVNKKRLRFERSRITFDDIIANGSGSVDYVAKPVIKTNLAFNAIDFKKFGGQTPEKSSVAAPKKSPDAPIDLSVLRSFDADINLRAKKISYGKLFGGPAKVSLNVKNGIANAQFSKVRFYSGRVGAQIIADGSKKIPSFETEAKIAAVDALPLLTDAADFKRLEGKLNATLSLTGAGATTGQMTRSLNGKTQMGFRDGAIRGIAIAKIYNNLAGMLSGGFKENSDDKTTFTELGMSFNIKDGVASTNDIKLLGPLVRMDGAGDIDLAQETIAMRLNPLVVGSASGQGGAFDVAGIGVPIMVQGPLAKPRVFPDLTNLLKNPQAALQTLSKFGLNFKNLGGIKNGKVENVIGDLISKSAPGASVVEGLAKSILNNSGKKSPADNTTIDNPFGTIMGQFGKMMNPGTQNNANDPVNDNQDTTRSKNGVPVPIPNPRKNTADEQSGSKLETPASIEKKIIDSVIPDSKNPADDPAKTINNLINGFLK